MQHTTDTSAADDTSGQTPCDPCSTSGGRPLRQIRRVGVYVFLLLALLPVIILVLMAGRRVVTYLSDIQIAAISTNKTHLPGILASQRTLINIENLRRYVETISNASSAKVRREATINALALATESVFEPDSRFAAHATSGKALIRGLSRVRERSAQAHLERTRAASRLLGALVRLEHEAQHEAIPGVFPPTAHLEERMLLWQSGDGQDLTQVLIPFLLYCQNLPIAMDSTCARVCSEIGQEQRAVQQAESAVLKADQESLTLWQQLDALLRTLSDLTSSEKAEKTYHTVAQIGSVAEQTSAVFYLSTVLMVAVLGALVLALHRFLLSPLALASRTLARIRDGHRVERLPAVRIREVQDMLDILPVLSQYVRDLSVRSGLLEKEKNKFRNLSLLDELTGVGNRRCFDLHLSESNPATPLALLMLDVDMFKPYNDTYGHLAGDGVLNTVAQTLRKSLLRASDQVFRYGGEEFCVTLPDATEESAMGVAERLRTAVQDVCIPHACSPVAEVVTISIGVALRQPREGITDTELVERADKALYAAKTQGRNRVCMAATTPYM